MAYKVGRCMLNERLRIAGLTPVQLSDLVNMSLSQISDYTSRRKVMSLPNAKSIAAALNCNIDDLYEWVYIDPLMRKRSKRKPE